MRNPLRKAGLLFLIALLGGLGILFVSQYHERIGDIATVAIIVPSVAALPFAGVWCIMALLAANGQARLRRGVGALARWSVPPNQWEAFRAVDAKRSAEGDGLMSDYTPRAAEGRAVEVTFGAKAVIVDEYYLPLRRFAVPELRWVNWLQRPGEPECLEFGVLYASKSSSVRTALRVPVPAAARALGVKVFHHFQVKAPKHSAGLAFRRPGLVIGWGLGVTAAAALVGSFAWMIHYLGNTSNAVVIVAISGIMSAIGAAFFTVVILLVVQPWKKRD